MQHFRIVYGAVGAFARSRTLGCERCVGWIALIECTYCYQYIITSGSNFARSLLVGTSSDSHIREACRRRYILHHDATPLEKDVVLENSSDIIPEPTKPKHIHQNPTKHPTPPSQIHPLPAFHPRQPIQKPLRAPLPPPIQPPLRKPLHHRHHPPIMRHTHKHIPIGIDLPQRIHTPLRHRAITIPTPRIPRDLLKSRDAQVVRIRVRGRSRGTQAGIEDGMGV